jgi:hypothetical protein
MPLFFEYVKRKKHQEQLFFSFRHRSRKRRPFSRYAARRRINSIYREKSININGDSKLIEEKLDQVKDELDLQSTI